jgi:hypothetical protein
VDLGGRRAEGREGSRAVERAGRECGATTNTAGARRRDQLTWRVVSGAVTAIVLDDGEGGRRWVGRRWTGDEMGMGMLGWMGAGRWARRERVIDGVAGSKMKR